MLIISYGVHSIIANNRRINNEFYIDVTMDESIGLGFVVRPFEVEQYICWGTPQNLDEYRNRNSIKKYRKFRGKANYLWKSLWERG